MRWISLISLMQKCDSRLYALYRWTKELQDSSTTACRLIEFRTLISSTKQTVFVVATPAGRAVPFGSDRDKGKYYFAYTCMRTCALPWV
jgi:hypothetical protein